MYLLSFQEALRDDSVAIDDASPIVALEMLWRAHKYAVRANSDLWEFAVEIHEFRRAHISNSDLRWLLSQNYAAHAIEMAASGNKRRFRRHGSNASLTERSCFIIAESGVALLKLINAGTISTTRTALNCLTLAKTRGGQSDGNATRFSAAGANPYWDSARRQLCLEGRLVKVFRTPAPNQQLILDAFQASEWSGRIGDPLPLRPAHCPKRRLHDAIKFLNRHHLCDVIRFGGDGSGRGVCWEHVKRGQ